MVDYLLSDEQVMIRDLCRQITEEKIKPVAAQYDQSEEFPWEVMKVMAESDLFGLFRQTHVYSCRHYPGILVSYSGLRFFNIWPDMMSFHSK